MTRKNFYVEQYARELARRVSSLLDQSEDSQRAAEDAAEGDPYNAITCYVSILNSWGIVVPERRFVVPLGHGGPAFFKES